MVAGTTETWQAFKFPLTKGMWGGGSWCLVSCLTFLMTEEQLSAQTFLFQRFPTLSLSLSHTQHYYFLFPQFPPKTIKARDLHMKQSLIKKKRGLKGNALDIRMNSLKIQTCSGTIIPMGKLAWKSSCAFKQNTFSFLKDNLSNYQIIILNY